MTASAFCLHVSVVVGLLKMPAVMHAQCKPGDPTGRFDGSATSSQAGKLDVSLNLVCNRGAYAGTLNTPIGVFVIHSGSFDGGTLKLDLAANGTTIHLEAHSADGALDGNFATADDKGPLALHRVGNAIQLDQRVALTPAQWHEDLAVLAKQITTLHPDAFANTPKSKSTRRWKLLMQSSITLIPMRCMLASIRLPT